MKQKTKRSLRGLLAALLCVTQLLDGSTINALAYATDIRATESTAESEYLSDTFSDSDYGTEDGQDRKYVIKYFGNAAGAENVPQDNQSYLYADSIVISNQIPTLENGVFISWNTDADGYGVDYFPEEGLQITEDMCLYAQWDISEAIDSNPVEFVELEAPKYYANNAVFSEDVGLTTAQEKAFFGKLDTKDQKFYERQIDDKCVRISVLNLLRRRCVLEKDIPDSEWKKLDINNVDAHNTAKQTLSNGHKIKFNLYYCDCGIHKLDKNATNEEFVKKDKNAIKSKVIELLKDHPEGIVYYLTNAKGGSPKHAVVITSYRNGIFYCVDPVITRDEKRGEIPIEESTFKAGGLKGKINYASYVPAGKDIFSAVSDGDRKVKIYCINTPCVVCKHPSGFGTDGYCKAGCGTLAPNKDNNVDYKEGLYKIKSSKSLSVKEQPFINAKSSGITYKSGTKDIKVICAVKNHFDELWYKIEKDGKSGYLLARDLQWYAALPPGSLSSLKIKINDTIPKGTSYSISGTITATNCKMTHVKGYFEDTKGKKFQTTKNYKLDDSDAATLSLKGSDVNKNLIFGKLAAGTYQCVVEVTTDREVKGSKVTKYYSNKFTVKNPTAASIKAPTITSTENIVGGVKYTIEHSNGNNVVLHYSVDNGKNYKETSKSSVPVNITSSTTIIAYVKDMSHSTIQPVKIPRLNSPEIEQSQNANGTIVSIFTENTGDTVYYKIDKGSYKKYTGAFSVTSQCTVYAYAEKKGAITSEVSSSVIEVGLPDTPVISLDTNREIGEGDAISVHWAPDKKAKNYEITITKDNVEVKKETVSQAQYTFNAEAAGSYAVTVVAVNAAGTSESSNTVRATVHSPATVRFVDYDNTLISEQKVKYGQSAKKPATPSRLGHTFDGWNGNFDRVTSDLTIVAAYNPNIYTVKFYDVDGRTLLGTQEIKYDKGIDSAKMEALVTLENSGRTFAGWHIFYVKEENSLMDLEHIDSDMRVCASTSWKEKKLPVYIENVSASINYGATSGVFNGYHVTCDISSKDDVDLKVKLLVTLLSESSTNPGVYKMINTKVDTLHLKADSSKYSWSGDVICDGNIKADRVEVSVVSIEGSDRTGGVVAETKYCEITDEVTVFWSEWMTESELVAAGHTTTDTDVDTKTQYRSITKTKSTITSDSAKAPEGYSLQSDNSYWGSWSSWSDTPVSATSTREVKTQQVTVSSGYTEYRYGAWKNSSTRHFCGSLGKSLYGGTWTKTYTDWSKTRYTATESSTWGKCSYSTHGSNHVGYTKYSGGVYYWTKYKINSKTFYWEESRYVDTSTKKTQYQYRNRINSYIYYKWNEGTCSAWGDEVLRDSNTSDPSYEVETRKLYRYKIYNTVGVKKDTIGVVRDVSGSMGSAFKEHKATILVYRSQNTDPTESQLEYVGQTTLDGNGAYEFDFITKEEPSVDTQDFIVALAIEGADNLVNIDVIHYERPEYKVTFETEDRSFVVEQSVQEGKSAEVPIAPEIEGYTFVGWGKNTTNVQKNISAKARYEEQTYCVAFVDYLNQTCRLERVKYDSTFTVPEEMDSLSYEGYVFEGWDYGDNLKITEDTVITAKWKAKEYRVRFYDFDGVLVESQSVPYGQAANPPTSLAVSEGYTFLGWSEETKWWDVCADVDVYPVVVRDETAVAPFFNAESYTEGIQEELEIFAAEGAIIYYTLDGSTPDPENVIAAEVAAMLSEYNDDMVGTGAGEDVGGEDGEEEASVTFLYQGPITISEDMYVTAIAVEEGKNISECATHIFSYEEEAEHFEEYGDMIELFADEVEVAKEDTVSIEVSLNGVNSLQGYMLAIDADPSVFSLIGAENEYGCELYAGDLCKGNGILFASVHEEGYGWKIYWDGEREISGSGDLFTLTFKVSDSAVPGKYPMKVSYSTGYTYDTETLEVSLDNITNVLFSKNGNTLSSNSGLKVLEIPDQIYTGKAIKPTVFVYDDGVLLTQNKDYTLSYKNNTKANDIADTDASPQVIIKGKGNYSDSMTVHFNILPADISDDEFACEEVVVKANGRVQKPVPVVYRNGKKLKAKKDFTVEYYDEDNAIVAPSAIGTYTIRVTGKDNYTGSREIALILSENEPMSKAKVAPISPRDYSGQPIEPEPVVQMGSTILTEDDYSLSYENNVNAGTATIVITGKNKYRGTKRVTFKINGIAISKAKILGLGQYTYNGTAIEPEIAVSVEDMVLTPETDYTLQYKNNKNVGTANVIVTGTGKYYGTLKKSFKIVGMDISQNKSDYQIHILDEQGEVITGNRVDVFYQKGGATPEVEVVRLSTGEVLKNGTDYTVSYKGNTKLSANQSKQAEVIVTGKKNYKGSLTKNFNIIRQDISKLDVLVSDKAFSKKAKGFMVTPIIHDTNGKRLVAGKDYEKTCAYVYVNDTMVNDKILRKAEEHVADTDIVPIGTQIKVTIRGKDCYAGSEVEAVYKIVANDIGKAQVVLKDKVYNGKNITLSSEKEEIRVIYNRKKLQEGVDYEIVGYENNRNKGKATVIIEGIGDYGGNKSVNFKIGTRNFLWWII